MQNVVVKILSIGKITPDVLRIVTDKPKQFTFHPGQATEVSINKLGWMDQKRPFTFTSLPQNNYLEFTIKTYPAHHGVTEQLLKLRNDDELLLHEVFGTIRYEEEGVFIAGGAGVTPFLSILRDLQSKEKIGHNRLIFANKSKSDIILEEELGKILGDRFINILADEKVDGYGSGMITEEFLKANSGGLQQHFYICGPPPMMVEIEKQLAHLGVDKKNIVKEEF